MKDSDQEPLEQTLHQEHAFDDKPEAKTNYVVGFSIFAVVLILCGMLLASVGDSPKFNLKDSLVFHFKGKMNRRGMTIKCICS